MTSSEPDAASADRRLNMLLIVSVATALVLVAVAVVAVLGLLRARNLEDQRGVDREDLAVAVCDRSIAGRDDNRAMWLYLFDVLEETPAVAAARAEFDRRLPSLVCIDNIPTPKKEIS